MEFLGEVLDQLPEVHALVGDVVEDGFRPVALEFHVADLHVETEAGRQLAGADHGLVLAGDGFLPALDVEDLGLAVDPAEFVSVGVDAVAGQLLEHDRSFERHDAQVVPVLGFHDHEVSLLDDLSGSVPEEDLAGILEPDFEEVAVAVLADAFHPVVAAELAAAGIVLDFQFADGRPLHFATAGAVILPGSFFLDLNVFHMLHGQKHPVAQVAERQFRVDVAADGRKRLLQGREGPFVERRPDLRGEIPDRGLFLL